MKKLSFLNALALFSVTAIQAQYCTPPDFSSGPFTGLLTVKTAGIDNTTKGTDGYTDYTSKVGSVGQGETVPITVKVEHTILNGVFSDKVDLRIWIDWNQDEDFDDPGEEVIKNEVDVSVGTGSYNTATFTGNIVVPSDAKQGKTRMRVYEDMLERDGHKAPSPCGYSSGIGQHGEAEDYSITVTAPSSVNENIENSQVSIFPNPASSVLEIKMNGQLDQNVSISIINSLGQEVLQVSSDEQVSNGTNWLVNVSELIDGVYFVKIESNGNQEVHQILIAH